MRKEFQRLKYEEQKQLGWSAKRALAKINYHIPTDYTLKGQPRCLHSCGLFYIDNPYVLFFNSYFYLYYLRRNLSTVSLH